MKTKAAAETVAKFMVYSFEMLIYTLAFQLSHDRNGLVFIQFNCYSVVEHARMRNREPNQLTECFVLQQNSQDNIFFTIAFPQDGVNGKSAVQF